MGRVLFLRGRCGKGQCTFSRQLQHLFTERMNRIVQGSLDALPRYRRKSVLDLHSPCRLDSFDLQLDRGTILG